MLRAATVWRTHHMNSITFRASKAKPCPVCGMGSKNCSALLDGLHFCRGDARDGWRKIAQDDAGFVHYRREAAPPAKPWKGKPPNPELSTNWQARAEKFAENLAHHPERRARLAGTLGLPLEALEGFSIGMNGLGTAATEFTIPERDGNGTVIGLATRIEAKGKQTEKKAILGSKRGLTIPDSWRDKPGPLLFVEGFTDTAALTAAGLCAIGRPSNLGGGERLAQCRPAMSGPPRFL